VRRRLAAILTSKKRNGRARQGSSAHHSARCVILRFPTSLLCRGHEPQEASLALRYALISRPLTSSCQGFSPPTWKAPKTREDRRQPLHASNLRRAKSLLIPTGRSEAVRLSVRNLENGVKLIAPTSLKRVRPAPNAKQLVLSESTGQIQEVYN